MNENRKMSNARACVSGDQRQPMSDMTNDYQQFNNINQNRSDQVDVTQNLSERNLDQSQNTDIENETHDATKVFDKENSIIKKTRKRKASNDLPFRRLLKQKRQRSMMDKNDCFEFELEHEDVAYDKNGSYDLYGRRIVSIKHFLASLQAISDHSEKSFGCRFSNLRCIGETRKGFVSILRLKCELCNAEFDVSTDDPNSNYDVNHGFVAGIISIGCGLENLNELAANADIPTMSKNKYHKTSQVVYDWYHKTAEEEMRKAGVEEAQQAKNIGSVDSEGNPMIAVIADGCWSKRSFRNNYSAASGAAAIIGAHTKKLLYLGVKNKYCMVCSRAANKKDEMVPEHICYKNFTGSSASMESTALVEKKRKTRQNCYFFYPRPAHHPRF